MRVAVLGHRGRLGGALVERGAVPLAADVTDAAALAAALAAIRPDAVINCAAWTAVDAAETHPAEAFAVNAGGPANLVRVWPGRLVHLSTDYIFDGLDGPYHEDARPNPLSIYGLSKWAGERALALSRRRNVLLVRTTVLFGGRRPDFVSALLQRLRAHGRAEATTRIVGTPTYVPWLADTLLRLLQPDRWAALMDPGNHVLHVAGRRRWSRYAFAYRVARIWGFLDGAVVPTDSVTGGARRPSKAGLRCTKLAALGIEPHDPLEGLEEMRDAE